MAEKPREKTSEKTITDVLYAKDYICHLCEEDAVVFVGLPDPDATKFPMCEEHEKNWRSEVLTQLREDEKKRIQ